MLATLIKFQDLLITCTELRSEDRTVARINSEETYSPKGKAGLNKRQGQLIEA